MVVASGSPASRRCVSTDPGRGEGENDRMVESPLPDNEFARAMALCALHLLDTPTEERFDRITRTASTLFGVPIALVNLVDTNRLWFKSCIGLPGTEAQGGFAFCHYTI